MKERSGQLRSATLPSVAFGLFVALFALLALAANTPAQTDDQLDSVPPPPAIVTKEERANLAAQSDLKAKTKLALEYMNTRLAEAERLNATNDFDGLFRELGRYRGLLDHTLGFLHIGNQDDKKVLDNYKRLEISLRSSMIRIEAIRRELPVRYEDYVHGLVKYLRSAREKALEPQFGTTVLPGVKPS
jgi:hypothetical protein